jgi:hypothetical protein
MYVVALDRPLVLMKNGVVVRVDGCWSYALGNSELSLWINFIIYGSLEIGVRKNNEKHRNK